MRRVLSVMVLVGCVVVQLGAQQLRGMGTIHGRITDDAGEPLADVAFIATLSGVPGGFTGLSDARGEWKLTGMGRGNWDVTFSRKGFGAVRAKVNIDIELARVPPIALKMKATK